MKISLSAYIILKKEARNKLCKSFTKSEYVRHMACSVLRAFDVIQLIASGKIVMQARDTITVRIINMVQVMRARIPLKNPLPSASL